MRAVLWSKVREMNKLRVKVSKEQGEFRSGAGSRAPGWLDGSPAGWTFRLQAFANALCGDNAPFRFYLLGKIVDRVTDSKEW